jgi:8-oxo-dGTP diphosphatase
VGEFKNPTPTVDAIIEIGDRIVLIERAHEPRGWALPGGFVDEGETVARACRREAMEETGLDIELVELFHVYSDPRRDARKHTVSTVFIARASGAPRAGDDAAGAALFRRDQLPAPLVFDHGLILADYFRYRDGGGRPPPER